MGAAFFRSPNALNSVLNSGVDFGLGANIEVVDGVEIVLEGGYDEFTLNSDNVALRDENLQVGRSSDVEGGEFALMNASIGLRYVLAKATDAHPYFTTGVGIYRSTIGAAKFYQSGQVVQVTGKRTTIGYGAHVAIGVDFQINDHYSFFFEPRYVVVDTADRNFGLAASTRFVPVRMGLKVAL